MSDETNFASPLPGGLLRSILDWQNAFVGLVLQAQQSQVQILEAWQKAAGDTQRDLWDRWICRFGGGVPIY